MTKPRHPCLRSWAYLLLAACFLVQICCSQATRAERMTEDLLPHWVLRRGDYPGKHLVKNIVVLLVATLVVYLVQGNVEMPKSLLEAI